MNNKKGYVERGGTAPRCMVYIVVSIVAMMLAGCKTQYVPVEVPVISRDTTILVKHKADSVRVHDSIYIHHQGDTVWREEWHTRYIERFTIDTLMCVTHDTIVKPYPVSKKVEKELTRWQQARLHLANLLLCAVLFIFGWKLAGRRR